MAKKSEIKKTDDVEDQQNIDNVSKEQVVVVDEDKKETVTKKTNEEATEDRIKELQAQMEASDKARKDAEERASKAEKDRQEAITKVASSQNDAVSSKEREFESAKVAVAASVTALEDQYQSALEAGDSKLVRDINTKLQKAIVTQDRIEQESERFTVWKKQQEEIAKRQPQQQGPSPAAQAWISRNPKFTTDPEFAQEAESAYALGERRGFAKDSVEHYKFVDSRLKQIYGSDNEPTVTVTEPSVKKEKTVSYSAPPSRGTGSSDSTDSGGKKVYKLTASQVEAAGFMGMTTIEYAQYLEAEKERG